MEEKRQSVLTRNGACLLSSALLNTIPVGFINVVPLVYLAQIGYDPSVIGAIYSASAIALSVGLIPFGVLADRYSRKRLLIVGTLVPAVSYVIFGLTLNPVWLIIASAIGGIGYAGGLASAVVTPALIPMLAGSTSDSRRPTLFAFLQGSWAVAFIVGSLLSLLPDVLRSVFGLSDLMAHSESYFIMAGVVVLSVAPLFLIEEKRDSDRHHEDVSDSAGNSSHAKSNGAEPAPSGSRNSWMSPSWLNVLKFTSIYLLLGLGLGVLVQLLPTWYALQYGATESSIGVWMAVSNLGTLFSIPIIPRLVRRWGVVGTASATGVVAACLLALMPLSSTFEMAALLYVIRGVAYGVSWATLQSHMTGIVVDKERAKMVGFAYTAWGVGAFAGTFIGGEMLGLEFLALPFGAGVVCYLASSAALPILFRSPKRAE